MLQLIFIGGLIKCDISLAGSDNRFYVLKLDHSQVYSAGGMIKYRVECVDRILPARRPINYHVDRLTMIMTC